MRITVSHTRPKDEVKASVDRSFDNLFRGVGGVPLQITNEKCNWNGDTLQFSFSAKVGFLSAPIKGTVEVTEREVIVNADLGLLEKLLPAASARSALEERVRGLLQ
ncbi:MAG TPA: polyhydroxyalkanoic acid system family protein [Bryobacteraceae bacterium]